MNRREFLQCTAAAAFSTCGALPAVSELSGAEIFVSPVGDDRHAGTPSEPVRTLEHALGLSRLVKQQTGRPAIILLHGGTYELQAPLRLTAADAGTAESPLRIETIGNEPAVLSGGSVLALSWHPYRDGIFQAKVPRGTTTDQLFVNGRRQILARYPNFDEHAHYLNGTAEDAIAPARIAHWHHPEKAIVHGMQKSLWGSLHYRVTGRREDGSLALDGGWQVDRDQPMHPEYRFVENVFEELDAPGEWFLDETAATLYYYPAKGLDLHRATIEVVRLKHLVEIGERQGEVTRGIALRGLEFRCTRRTFMETSEQLLRSDWRIYRGGAVLIENAEDISCSHCRFDQMGGNAIFVSGHARRVSITSCRIEEAGASGVCLVGRPESVRNALLGYHQTIGLAQIDRTPGPRSPEYPADCTVDDCLITRTGRLEKQTAGVEISMSQSVQVVNCSIYDVPRAGINIGDGTFGGHVVDGCDVFNTVLETSDHGAFNAWGRDRWWHLDGVDQDQVGESAIRDLPTLDAVLPTTLRRSRWACAHGWDIDLDDGSSNYHIHDNLCLCGGIKLREGFFRVAEDNVTVNNTFHVHVWPRSSHDVTRRNIVFLPYRPIRTRGWGDVIDENFLHHAQARTGPAVELQQISGGDTASLVGDAAFVNLQDGDCRLQASSPARTLGITGVGGVSYGVRSPHLRAVAASADIATWLATPPATLASVRRKDTAMWMGATVRNLVGLGEMSEKGAPTETGVIFEEIPAGSIAAQAGWLPGDLLLEFDGHPVPETGALPGLTRGCSTSKTALLRGLRQQKPIEIHLICRP